MTSRIRLWWLRALHRIEDWARAHRGPTCVHCDRSVYDDGTCHALHPLRPEQGLRS